jgi:hypothetical protein
MTSSREQMSNMRQETNSKKQETRDKQHVRLSLVSCLLSLACLLSPFAVSAAEIFFGAKNKSFAQGEVFLVNMFLSAEGESVNAADGRVVFPTDLLEAREIRDGNSVITLWVEKPKSYILNSKSYVSFSGVTPGGFSGEKEFLFSVLFRAKKTGNGLINTEGIRVLQNDGEGTEVLTKTSPFSFSISQAQKIAKPPLPDIEQVRDEPKDTELPEDFKPIIISDPNMFAGKQALVFVTEDKGSGIDHYEVREGLWGWFSVAESPYLLRHQWLDKEVFVKAIDKTGNERTAILLPKEQTPQPEPYATSAFAILIIPAIAIVLLLKKIWARFK